MNNQIMNSGKRAIRATQILQCKKECADRGITVSQWCQEHGLSEKSYWYYHKKLGDALYEVARPEGMVDTAPQIGTPTFVEVTQFPVTNGSGNALLRMPYKNERVCYLVQAITRMEFIILWMNNTDDR